jgi:ATP-dependent Clp protease ATP-binding subunit ClpC
VFERFTAKARKVLVLAQYETIALAHLAIGPEHLLIGLVEEGEGIGAKALASFGLTTESTRAQVLAVCARRGIAPRGKKGTPASPPFAPEAKKLLEQALKEALELGHNYMGTEHLLLSLTRQEGGVAADALAELGVSVGAARQRVLDLLSGLGGEVGPPRLSPPLTEAMDRATAMASPQPVTTGDVLRELLGQKESQAAQALAALGVSPEQAELALAAIPINDTTDAPPGPKSVEIRLGEVTTEIADADLASALLKLPSDQLASLLREAIKNAGE